MVKKILGKKTAKGDVVTRIWTLLDLQGGTHIRFSKIWG
jgi:hypothetical protein